MTFNRLLVTAALPYANGPVHIGHLAGCYLPADIYVRYQRAQNRDVKFICGSDEHGVPITIRAMKEGITPRKLSTNTISSSAIRSGIWASPSTFIPAPPRRSTTTRRKRFSASFTITDSL